MAAVAITRPFSTSASLVVPPPMSMLRMRLPWSDGHARGAGAVARQHRLHVVAGGGGDEIAALLGQQAGDRLGVVAAQRLAGEDHHAGVDVLGARCRACL